MHVRSSHRNISKCRYAEFANVFDSPGEAIQARIRFRIRRATGQIVQAGIPEWRLWHRSTVVDGSAVEAPAAMALKPSRAFTREEENLTTFGGIAQSTDLAVEFVAVVRRLHRNDSSLKGGQRFRDVFHRVWIGFVTKGLWK